MDGSPEYDDFVRSRTPALLRLAYVLTGDQHLAEDLVQSALARTHRAWGRLHEFGNAEAYTRKVMYHLQVSWWRRRRVTESISAEVPEPAFVSGAGDPGERVAVRATLRQALLRLTPSQRAVLVLRYFEDRSEAATAQALGVSLGTVKSQTSRALERLRAIAPELAGAAFTSVADEVRVVDVRERALQTSRRMTQNRRVGVVAGIILAVVAVTGGAVAALSRTDGPGPQPGQSVSPSPSATPTGEPPASMRIRGVNSFDNERPTGLLDDAIVPVADWSHDFCPVGPTQFADGLWEGELLFETFTPTATLSDQILADVNGDGVDDVVALLECGAGTDPGGYAGQVAVYTPSGPGWELLDQVAVTNALAPVVEARVSEDRTLTLVSVTRDTNLAPQTVQTQQYSWTGSEFAQTGPPTSVPVSSYTSDLRLSVTPSTLPGGSGDLVVTVTNAGGTELTEITIAFDSPEPYLVSVPGGEPTPMGDAGADAAFGRYFAWVTIDPVQDGGAAVGTFHLSPVGAAGPVTVRLWATGPAGLEVSLAAPAVFQVLTP